MDGSLLLEEAGALTRWSGVFTALTFAIVLFAGADIGSIVPKAILAGMLVYLGVMVLAELLRSAQRSWTDAALATVMTLAIMNFGYLQGVALGVIGACILFALSYSRIGLVKRHLTRKNSRAMPSARLICRGCSGERVNASSSGSRASSSSAPQTVCSNASEARSTPSTISPWAM